MVVPGARKGRDLLETVGQPGRLSRQIDEAILDDRGLRVEKHLFIALGLDAFYRAKSVFSQILNQLSAGGLVLDNTEAAVRHFAISLGGAQSTGATGPSDRATERFSLRRLPDFSTLRSFSSRKAECSLIVGLFCGCT